jgi:hypothetical protein
MDVMDIHSLFEAAQRDGRVGLARKSQSVDARPAFPGEIVVTIIADEGMETQSKPAAEGDMIVRNRCEPSGNEEYLVNAEIFAQRYQGPVGPADAHGWHAYRPLGPDMLFVVVRPEDGEFSFTAPWGEPMVARPGDIVIRNPADPRDTYRVAAAAFECTYEILDPRSTDAQPTKVSSPK